MRSRATRATGFGGSYATGDSRRAAVLILGLAIGANTAIFSLVNAVLFREQAFADPDRLVNIYQNDPAGRPLVVSAYAAYMQMAEYTDIFAATMAASIPNSRPLSP